MSIYALIDPRDGKVRYIGQTWELERRLRSHLETPPPATEAWIMELAALGLVPKMEVLETEVERSAISRREQAFINLHRKTILNRMNGGGGRPPTPRGAGSPQVVVRLSVDELARLQVTADAEPPTGVSIAELLRRRAGL